MSRQLSASKSWAYWKISSLVALCLLMAGLCTLVARTPVLWTKGLLAIDVSDDFSQDLSCKIKVGSDRFPCFATKGGNGRVKSARIIMDISTMISVVRGEESESYYLYFFSEDKERKGLWSLRLKLRRSMER